MEDKDKPKTKYVMALNEKEEKVVHMLATVSLTTPSWAWRCVCGWKFLNANKPFTMLDEKPKSGFRMCKKCCRAGDDEEE